MKCLVTGGAGFIGSHIVEALVKRGDEVVVIDNLSSGKHLNLYDIEPSRYRLFRGDIRDDDLLENTMRGQGIDIVFHEAAIVSVPQTINDPWKAHDVNINGMLKLMTASIAGGVKRFVFASSSAVYGDSPALPKVETMAPETLSPYAAQKLAGEAYCRVFNEVYGLPTVCLRYFNVYGPRQNPESDYAAVIPRFITRMAQGKPPIIYGDGLQTRDFVYVKDIVRANLIAAEHPDAPGKVMNICSTGMYTILTLADTIARRMDFTYPPIFEPARDGEVRHSVGTNNEAKNVMRWKPSIDFSDGIRQTVEWYMKKGSR